MKPSSLLFLPTILGAVVAQAQLTCSSGVLNAAVPDDTSTGYVTLLSVLNSGEIASISVTLNLSVPSGETGWFGDLYAYVQHGPNLAVLLNRPGRSITKPNGYGDSQSVDVVFKDAAAQGDIHTYRQTLFGDESTPLASTLTGSWAPDGRTTDPAQTVVTDARPALLSVFTGQDMAGSWTLFVADMSGGGQYQVDSWGLSITAVPEPAAWEAFALVSVLGFSAWRRRKNSNKG